MGATAAASLAELVVLRAALRQFRDPVCAPTGRGGTSTLKHGLLTAYAFGPASLGGDTLVAEPDSVCTHQTAGSCPIVSQFIECRTCAMSHICRACALHCHVGHFVAPPRDTAAAATQLSHCLCGAGATCSLDSSSRAGSSDRRLVFHMLRGLLELYLLAGHLVPGLPAALRTMQDDHGYIPLNNVLALVRDRGVLPASEIPDVRAVARYLHRQPSFRMSKLGSSRPRIAPRHPCANSVMTAVRSHMVAAVAQFGAGVVQAALKGCAWGTLLGTLRLDAVIDGLLLESLSETASTGGPSVSESALVARVRARGGDDTSTGSGGGGGTAGVKRPRPEMISTSAAKPPLSDVSSAFAPSTVAADGVAADMEVVTTSARLNTWCRLVGGQERPVIGIKCWWRDANDLEDAYLPVGNARLGKARPEAPSSQQFALPACRLTHVYLQVEGSGAAVLLDVDAIAADSGRDEWSASEPALGFVPTVHVSPACAAVTPADMDRSERLAPLHNILSDPAICKVSFDSSEELLWLQSDLGLHAVSWFDWYALIDELMYEAGTAQTLSTSSSNLTLSTPAPPVAEGTGAVTGFTRARALPALPALAAQWLTELTFERLAALCSPTPIGSNHIGSIAIGNPGAAITLLLQATRRIREGHSLASNLKVGSPSVDSSAGDLDSWLIALLSGTLHASARCDNTTVGTLPLSNTAAVPANGSSEHYADEFEDEFDFSSTLRNSSSTTQPTSSNSREGVVNVGVGVGVDIVRALTLSRIRSELMCLRAPPYDPGHDSTLRIPILTPPWYTTCELCGAAGHFSTDCLTFRSHI